MTRDKDYIHVLPKVWLRRSFGIQQQGRNVHEFPRTCRYENETIAIQSSLRMQGIKLKSIKAIHRMNPLSL